MDCVKCHNSDSWSYAKENTTFDHDSTNFPLFGQHKAVECKSCHTSLEFKKANTDCNSCHIDIHQQTVGLDCARCHNSDTWIVSNVTELHERTSFPLIGVHATVDCNQCHQTESQVRFSPVGLECMDCHRPDYIATTRPNHAQAGFSNDCASCHSTLVPEWSTDKVDHSFFPLEKAHKLDDCTACHKGGSYSDISPDCFSCHQQDFNATTNPKHSAAGFAVNCNECHTTDPGWTPVNFTAHDALFPIYSGKHNGVWNDCIECHKDPNNFAVNTCVSCHTNPETDNNHSGVSGYVYRDEACLGCHPTGDAGTAFNHNATAFPLTGAHIGLDCIECHAAGYIGTSTLCVDCHTADFNATSNPNHNAIGINTDCASCHTTTPGWEPATFSVHDQYYAFNGAHALISNDCATCHNGNYNSTPNTCIGCHQSDYTATTNPNHISSNFPTDCASCHSENAWQPSSFNHDGLYFPIFSGKHLGVWDNCIECHTNTADFSQVTCITCHANPETNEVHNGVSGYVYNSSACLGCHPTGDADATFDHNATDFPLTGGHLGLDCLQCHSGGFAGTSTACINCHTNDYNGATNPNHNSLGLGPDCISCHTTTPGWAPATFAVHNTFYPLNGAHAAIATDCNACHNGNYTTTPNTCVGCHQSDFAGTTNPNHVTSQFSTNCANCHSESAWEPSIFNHNNVYPLTGAHAAIATNCVICHNGNYANTPNTCAGCHQDDFNATTNPNHVSNQFSINCTDCHTNSAWEPSTFNHNTVYPLTGAHAAIASNCVGCHNGNYNNTPNTCAGCHQDDFNATTNPNHVTNQFSINCIDCHSNSAWEPSSFNHNTVYPLTGAHSTIANNCVVCHNGNYNNTPNTCAGCHQDDFNGTTNPNHVSNQFSINCIDCHNNSAWEPSTFNHNTVYPLTGAHAPIANNCISCHTNGNYNNTPNTCAGCHQDDFNGTTNPNHISNQFSINCTDCHSNNAWNPSTFNHNTIYPLTGAHATIANNCVACHVNGNYNNTPNTCVGCHQSDFNSTTNPNHVSNQFSTTCTECHTNNAWSPSAFDHSNIFPFVGAHIAIANNCVSCHNGNYNNTPNTCVGCHQSDYNGATNPNHAQAQFSTDCISCHTQTAWEPSTFDHDELFPIYSGKHDGEWNQCSECHTNPNNYSQFNCLNCHNDQGTLTTIHENVNNYQYNSNACFACHPNGEN